MKLINRLDHVGIAVGNLKEAVEIYDRLFGLKPSLSFAVPQHGVGIAFLPAGSDEVELLESLKLDSRVGSFIASKGEGIYHICLEVADVDRTLAAIEKNGGNLTEKKGWMSSLGRKVAFVGPGPTHGVLIELIEPAGNSSTEKTGSNSFIRKIAHIAIAVNKLDEAMATYDKLLGLKVSHVQTVPEQGVKVAFLPVGDVEIELLEPLGPESGVAKFLERKGQGLHHLCFEVADVNKELESVASRGGDLIDKKARRGAEGMIGFIHPRSTKGALIEFLQKD